MKFGQAAAICDISEAERRSLREGDRTAREQVRRVLLLDVGTWLNRCASPVPAAASFGPKVVEVQPRERCA
jgi:hypothetical protein